MSKVTAAIAVIVAAQFVAIFMLHGKLDTIEQGIRSQPVVEPDGPFRRPSVPASPPSHQASSAWYPTESELRRVIQEELRAQLPTISMPGQAEIPAVAQTPTDPEQLEEQRGLVTQQLDYYVSVGRISTMEMQDLQASIGRLDDAGRREMLSRLVRAINNGELEGHL